MLVAGLDGQSRVLAIQPFLHNAVPLDTLDPASLSPLERLTFAGQLAQIIARSLACFHDSGMLPDLYGLSSHDGAQARRWDLRWVLRVGWRMLAGRPLIDAHNLLRTADGQVILVDYDPLCVGSPGCRLVYLARAILLIRDRTYVRGLL